MSEAALHSALAWGVIATALPTLLWLVWRSAPYGRHARPGWGPSVGARAGWILMESPSVFFFGAVYALGDRAAGLAPLVLMAFWQAHYVYRALVFPFRVRSGRPMPLLIALTGVLFNLINSGLNARWISHLGDYPDRWLTSPAFVAGAALFVAGAAINHHSDALLLRLRRPGETGYRVPSGGLYRWVSCPNYLGEMIEWMGWAVMTWSLAGSSFFVFTVANLLPRALAHHRWYRETFPDYPAERRAILPLLL